MSAKDRIKEAIKTGVPDPIVFRISPPIIEWYSKAATWCICGRHYEAPINPTDLIYVDPTDVEEMMTDDSRSHLNHSNVISEVIDGPWDELTRPLSDYHLYRSFQSHFEEGVPWEHTELYEVRKQRFAQGEYNWGCENMTEFESRLDTLDQMFINIKKEGYKSQRELRSHDGSDIALRDIHRYWPPELHEVIINIGREGKLILHDGRHRLSIAKILEIDEIPVRVKVRHEDWQGVRDDKIADNTRQTDDHPDLRF